MIDVTGNIARERSHKMANNSNKFLIFYSAERELGGNKFYRAFKNLRRRLQIEEENRSGSGLYSGRSAESTVLNGEYIPDASYGLLKETIALNKRNKIEFGDNLLAYIDNISELYDDAEKRLEFLLTLFPELVI